MVKTLPFFEALAQLNLPHLHRNLFSSPEWMAAIHKTYGVRLFVKYIEENGQVRSYIIYSVVRNFLEEKICICSYCDYCDCPVASAEDWRAFFSSLREDYPQFRIAVRNLRDETIRQSPDFRFLYFEMFHLLDVREDMDIVWKRTHDSFKAAVRQAERGGVRVRPCGKENLADFFRMHLQVRKHKYRLFPQPYRFFENIWQEYMEKDKGILLGAFSPQGKIIGANMYLICDKTLYYKFNTSSLDALELRPNNILFWEGMKFAKQRGLDFVDLGSSGYNQWGLILFKDHTGAQKFPIYHFGFAPRTYQFSKKRILNFLTRTFTARWMPDGILKLGSDIIYHNLA